MGFDYAGLICLLVGLGAFFAHWLRTMGNRSKTVESEMASAEHPVASEHNLHQGVYSLSPEQNRQPNESGEPDPEHAVVDQASLDAGPANTVSQTAPVLVEQDSMVDNQIEMANLLFNMGDFEGAIEMCQLILDNPSASGHQIGLAQELKARC